jgi:activating signal cointegrator complex subunit 2
MHEIWHRPDQKLRMAMDDHKKSLIKVLESSAVREFSNDLRPLADIMRASPDVAAQFMTGTDFLDGLIAQHSRCTSLQEKQLFVTVTYLGLLSLAQVDVPNVSLLSDHLYSLKTSADGAKTSTTTLITDLVTNTPLIAKLRMAVTEDSGDRLFKLLDVLETYRTPSSMWPKKQLHRKRAKGKGRAIHNDGEMHMHRMSLVTQVHDLFPELGSGFVLKLLDEYGDDVEQVTAHLLDDSLTAHLRDLDRAEEGPAFQHQANGDIESLIPRSTPSPPNSYIPERRNVFDDDELDRLEVDTSRLHIGKKKDVTSDGQANKAAILSALAAFDSDDDERDDTYDVEDVGGTVDTAHPDGEPGPVERELRNDTDMVLFGAYTSSPDLFARTADARKKKGRHALKAETRMTDEAIEGWAIILQRDPRRMRKLEAQFNSFDGKQAEVARTAYREGVEGTETEDSDAAPARGGFRGGFQGRGRGRGGNVAGPAKDPKTAIARDRKEANKSSRANHNRRDQRARKMARGGFPG